MCENEPEFFIDDNGVEHVEPRGFTARNASRYLGIGIRLLIELSDHGDIPCYHLHGHRLYLREDLNHWIDRQIESLDNKPS